MARPSPTSAATSAVIHTACRWTRVALTTIRALGAVVSVSTAVRSDRVARVLRRHPTRESRGRAPIPLRRARAGRRRRCAPDRSSSVETNSAPATSADSSTSAMMAVGQREAVAAARMRVVRSSLIPHSNADCLRVGVASRSDQTSPARALPRTTTLDASNAMRAAGPDEQPCPAYRNSAASNHYAAD